MDMYLFCYNNLRINQLRDKLLQALVKEAYLDQIKVRMAVPNMASNSTVSHHNSEEAISNADEAERDFGLVVTPMIATQDTITSETD